MPNHPAFLRRRPAGAADLSPWRELEPAGEPGVWRSTGPTPQFRIPISFSPGWVRLRLRMAADRAGRLELHADGGGAGASLFRAEVHGAAEVDCFVRIASAAQALRLDPPGGVGEVRLDQLRIEPLSRAAALGYAIAAKLRLLRKYWHTGAALRRGLGLLARGDFARLRDKLFRGLNGPDLEGGESSDEDAAYQVWRRRRELKDVTRARLRAEAAAFADPPTFSIVMHGDGATECALARSVQSVLRQTYAAWRLFIPRCAATAVADHARQDDRIQIVEAADVRLAAASGDYVTFLYAGDELAEQALSSFARILAGRGLDMAYADEDRLTPDGRHVEPYFKPDWSPDLLASWMYVGRPGVFRSALVRESAGADEHELARRLAAGPSRVGHVPDVLYHRRSSFPAAETPRPAPRSSCGEPLVSIIIPSACLPVRVRGERTFYLIKCLESIQKSTWPRREIIVMHGPKTPAALRRRLDEWGASCVPYPSPFNWSRAMNRGASLARGQHLLFLNDDVEVITPDWLERMLEFSQVPDVGAVGAKLLFPGGRIQHAGVAVLGGRPAHPFYGQRGDHPGYFNNLLYPRNCSAVTGACLMTRADVFRTAGGFDESFPLNYNDVDYCLRLVAGGRRVVCTPHARLYHHELGTRPAGVRPAERDALIRRWGEAWADDPFHNPNLSDEHLDFRIRAEPRRSGL